MQFVSHSSLKELIQLPDLLYTKEFSVADVLFGALIGVKFGILDEIDGKIGLGGHGYAGVAVGTLLKTFFN